MTTSTHVHRSYPAINGMSYICKNKNNTSLYDTSVTAHICNNCAMKKDRIDVERAVDEGTSKIYGVTAWSSKTRFVCVFLWAVLSKARSS